MTTFTPNNKHGYTTRDGREVRIYATDGGHRRPLHGAVREPGDNWTSASWLSDGRYLSCVDSNDSDLIDKPPPATKVVRWEYALIDRYGLQDIKRFDVEADAISDAYSDRRAGGRVSPIQRIEFEVPA